VKTSHGLVMDGFVRGDAGKGNTSNNAHKITEASNLLKGRAASTKIKSAAQGVHQRAQRSQTLMRTAVKKPALNMVKNIANQPKKADIESRTNHIDNSRLARVQSIDKNNKVRRFGHGVNAGTAKAAPTPKVEVGEVMPRKSEAQPARASAETLKPLPSMVTSVSHQNLERMLDEALTKADAHKRPKRGQMHNQSIVQKIKNAPRWLSFGATAVVLIILVSYIAMNRVPSVAVRVAATKAHIKAQVPAYVPSGFSFAGPVNYSDGSVSIKFKANDSSNREFTVKQTGSKMSSKSLEDKIIPKDTQVQTSVVNGNTVYIYGQSNDAAWVNNNIQYTIADSANLNSDQLLKIASSL
jgi:hypothetical protein